MLEAIKSNLAPLLDLRQCRKAIAAAVGVGLLLFLKYENIELPGLAHAVSDLVIGALTVGSVYQVPNQAPRNAEPPA